MGKKCRNEEKSPRFGVKPALFCRKVPIDKIESIQFLAQINSIVRPEFLFETVTKE